MRRLVAAVPHVAKGRAAACPSPAGRGSTRGAEFIADDWAWAGPMMLWNLNFAPGIGSAFSESGYSILRSDGERRPAYLALERRGE